MVGILKEKEEKMYSFKLMIYHIVQISKSLQEETLSRHQTAFSYCESASLVYQPNLS